MRRHLLVWVLVLAGFLAGNRPAAAQSLTDTLNKISNDFTYLMVDGPVYLSGRLPVMISGSDFLASMELASIKNFTLGLSLSSAFFTSFNRLDDNFQLVPKKFPAVVRLEARFRQLALLLALALALLLIGCNPLDPDAIEPDSDSGGTSGSKCQPACSSSQYCVQEQSGGCGCYNKCDDSLCVQAGYPSYKCIKDQTGVEDCYDLSQVSCN